LLNTVGEIVITQPMLSQLSSTSTACAERLRLGLALDMNIRERRKA
jgi:hypothetical protein